MTLESGNHVYIIPLLFIASFDVAQVRLATYFQFYFEYWIL